MYLAEKSSATLAKAVGKGSGLGKGVGSMVCDGMGLLMAGRIAVAPITMTRKDPMMIDIRFCISLLINSYLTI